MSNMAKILFVTVLSFPYCMFPAAMAEEPEDTFRLETVSDTLSYLCIGADRWKLPFPVYRFETADVNGDGSTDAIVGVVKSTRYDPVVRRRVFVFKNYRGHVRPLWLGSRMGRPIVDFHFLHDRNLIEVKEISADGTYFYAYYRWRSFGMEFVEHKDVHSCGAEENCPLGKIPTGDTGAVFYSDSM